MIHISRDDENLQGLVGASISSDLSQGTTFRPEQMLGKGGAAIAFLAKRRSNDGEVPVVLKILRPAFVKKLGPTAHLLIRKEAVALGRLNERTPPTPFVIRLIDTGSVRVMRADSPLDLPWVAVEYVHGGVLGTTLAQRVRRSLRDTGFAFDAVRAANAIDCVANGLAAVHEVNVIHRDLTPNNVLCSGRGAEELFKIADFGVARPTGITGTLSGALVGTPGYAPPELSAGADAHIGTWTDVFSFASIIFFVLTGEALFNSAAEVVLSMESNKRRSLLEMPSLHPELRKNEKACRSIDLVLAWASAGKSEARLTEALAVSSMVLPHLAAPAHRQRLHSYSPVVTDASFSEPSVWTWNTLHQPGSNLVIRSVAWDGHGRAIAATREGLSFWNGTSWRVATTDRLRSAGGVRFVQRVGAGRWVMGSENGTLAIYTTGGETQIIQGPRDFSGVEAFGGDLEDISVLVTSSRDGVIGVNTYATKRWLRPLPLPDVASISAISRFDDSRWLLAGRKKAGGAYAALYGALDWEIQPIETPKDARAFIACAGRWRKQIGYFVGTQGTVLCRDGDATQTETVPGEPFLSAVAFDPFGRPWSATAGRILYRDDQQGFINAWSADFEAPIVSLFLDVGLCLAMTADGGVIEGRAPVQTTGLSTPPPPMV